MPASLPANTAYTYAFEVNADEAVAAGAPEIEFSEPLIFYTDNFLNFPAGTAVPLGSYDREAGAWMSHDNGIVVAIVGEANGLAALDLTGDGVAEGTAPLLAAGISDAERERMAQEIHDTLAQSLTAIGLDIEGALRHLRASPDRARERLERALTTTRDSLEEARRSVQDLRGKTIVYAQNSPSQYFVNNLLINAGVQPSEVNHRYTATAFEAAAAFVADKSIDACVSWAPDIYNIPERVQGTRILTTTAEANKLIADVWAVRADFAKDHPEIVRGLVEGIFKATARALRLAVEKDPRGTGVPSTKGVL